MNLEEEIKILYKIKKGIAEQAHHCIINGNYSALVLALKHYKEADELIDRVYKEKVK